MENKIRIKRLNCVPSGGFDCGYNPINKMISESYYPDILQYAYSYQVLFNDLIVAYYMINLRNIRIENCAALEDYISGIVEDCTCVHIEYIAVDKKYHNKGIGHTIMKHIIKQVLQECKTIPIRLIILDALKGRENFYKGVGFEPFNDSKKTNYATKMYLDCLLDKNKVNCYVNEILKEW